MRTSSAHKQQKLLVIGTQPAAVVLLKTMLSVGKVHVLATDEPEAAIRLVDSARGQIGLALVDVSTIEVEPRLLAERLKAIQPEIAILFFSSLADGEVIRLGILDSERGILRQEGVVNAIENALRAPAAPVKPEREKPLKTLTAGKLFDSPAM
jgi:response regulator RpfG family c-di-GMP phosphodiesterase